VKIAPHLAHYLRKVAVDASIEAHRFGYCVGRATILVRANADQAAGNRHGLAADVYIEDEHGDLHSLPDSAIPSILDEVEREDPTAWRDIIAASGKQAA
jgi:hypothetical protein